MELYEAYIETPLGVTRIAGSETGLTAVYILDPASDTAATPPDEIVGVLQPAADQLREYFAGKRREFDLSLQFQGSTFQQSVWRELLTIPYGRTITYTDLARRLGYMKALRAVAAANGQNRFWIVVPCHRVIGRDGSLVGYAGGLWRKKWLLEHESPYRQQSLFG